MQIQAEGVQLTSPAHSGQVPYPQLPHQYSKKNRSNFKAGFWGGAGGLEGNKILFFSSEILHRTPLYVAHKSQAILAELRLGGPGPPLCSCQQFLLRSRVAWNTVVKSLGCYFFGPIKL